MKTSEVFKVGLKNQMKCGQTAEILEYLGADKIRIRFENGYECITRPEQFKRGQVKNRLLKYKFDVGSENTAVNGLKMTVIQRKDKNHLLVRFPDGYEKWVTSQAFKLGHVAHPDRLQKGHSKYIGEKIERDGHVAQCTLMENGKLVIKFDSGEIKNLCISQWRNKRFLFPHESRSEQIKNTRQVTCKNKFLGLRAVNKAGLEMEIVEYENANNIKIRFTKTGYETWTNRQTFKNGQVQDKIALKNRYLSMSIMQCCGLNAKIVEYEPGDLNPKNKTAAQYTIAFEDGYQIKNTGMHEFLKGVLTHPERPMKSGSVVNGVKIIKKLFHIGDQPQMKCVCQNCGWTEIASFKEIYEHKCPVEDI